jgi:hypothetical protein
MLIWPFYSNRVWELDGTGRVGDDGGVNSILWFWLERGGDRRNVIERWSRPRARFGSMRRKRAMMWWNGDVGQRRGTTREGKETRRRQLGWRESYWAEKKSMRTIQLLQMDGEDLNQWWINLIFLKHMHVRSSFIHLITYNTTMETKF